MPAEAELLARALVAPGLAAFIVARLVARRAPAHWAPSAAAAIGLAAGYALLEPKAIWPKVAWNWLPWVGLSAALVGPWGTRGPRRANWVWALWIVAVVGYGWLLTPSWKKLEPWRYAYVAGAAGMMFASAASIDRLAARSAPVPNVIGIVLATLVTSILLAVQSSLRMGMLGLAACAALVGSVVGSQVSGWRTHLAEGVRGLALFQAAIVVGLLLTAYVANAGPFVAILFIALAPSAAWLVEAIPLSRTEGMKGAALRLAIVVLMLTTAGALLYLDSRQANP